MNLVELFKIKEMMNTIIYELLRDEHIISKSAYDIPIDSYKMKKLKKIINQNNHGIDKINLSSIYIKLYTIWALTLVSKGINHLMEPHIKLIGIFHQIINFIKNDVRPSVIFFPNIFKKEISCPNDFFKTLSGGIKGIYVVPEVEYYDSDSEELND